MEKPTELEAYNILEQLEIPFERVDHEPITSVKSYDAELPGPQVKNLLLKSKKDKRFFFVILPEDKSVNLKELAEELEVKRLSFASAAELEELIGLKPGTVTPIALNHDVECKIQVVIDNCIDQNDTIGLHPNVNTTTIIMSFVDFTRLLTWSEHPAIYKNM